jgi:hypothetical protein
MTARRDIILSIIADTKRYQAELAKTEGHTAKSAARMAAVAYRFKVKEEEDKRKLAMKRIDAETKAANKAAKQQSSRWASVGKTVAAAFAGAVTSGMGLVTLGDSISQVRNELRDMSVQTGVSTDTLEALRFGSALTGKELQELQGGLQGFAQRMTQAERDGGPLLDIFRGLGIELRDLDGNIRPLDETFRETIAKLSSMEDETLRTSAATQLFGDVGGKLIGISRQLGGDLDATAAAVVHMGGGFDEANESAERFQRMSALLALQLDAVKVALLPVATSFMEGLVGGIEFSRLALIGFQHDMRTTASLLGVVQDAISNGTVPAMEDFHEVIRANTEISQKAIEAELESFAALYKGIQGVTGAQVDQAAILAALAKSQKEIEQANQAKAESDKAAEDAAKAQAEAVRLLAADNLLLLDGEGKLLDAADKRIQKIAALKAAGAEEATILALQTAEVERLKTAINELRTKEMEELRKEYADIAKEFDGLGEQLEASLLQAAQEMRDAFFDSAAFVTDTTGALLGSMGDIAGFAVEDAQKAGQAIKGSIGELRDEISELESQKQGASEAEKERIDKSIRWRQKQIGIEQKDRMKARKEIRKAFKAQKALQISQTIASGATAGIRVFADLPHPAAVVAAFAIALQTGSAIETIRRQKPPKFFRGISRVEPDEQSAVLHRGEAVLTRRAAATLGRRRIEDLNQGRPSGDAPIGDVVVYLGRELLGRENMTRGGSHVAVGASSPYMGR